MAINTRAEVNANHTVSLPFLFWVWIFFTAIETIWILLYTPSFGAALLIATALSTVFYLMFVAKAARIVLQNNSIEFRYFSPLLSNVIIDVTSVAEIELDLSYFFLFNEDSRLGKFDLMHPYDTVVFKLADGAIRTIHFNSNHFGTKKLLKKLRGRLPQPRFVAHKSK